MKETEIGISEFATESSGFFGIIKQRYSDFIVNEIAANDTVVKLDSQEIPQSISDEVNSNDSSEPPCHLSLETINGIQTIAYKNSELNKIKEKINSSQKDEILIPADDLTKCERIQIHNYVKQFVVLDSSTIYVQGKKFMRITPAKKTDRRNSISRANTYTTFVLYKENMDTMDVVNHMTFKLRLKPSSITYAGTKDRRAKTSQKMCAYKVSPQKLLSITQRLKNIHIGNFSFSDKPIKLGQLRGNAFNIVIREVKASDNCIANCVNCLLQKGFVNYFGMQRFGTTNIGTHQIGMELLKANWLKAIDLILSEKENDPQHVKEAKRIWFEDRNPKGAYDAYSKIKRSGIEGLLLNALVGRWPRDLVGALEKVPRNMRMLYVHSYQSFIWNKIVSLRIQKFGFKVLLGDLVKKKETPKYSIDEDGNDNSDIAFNTKNETEIIEEEFNKSIFQNDSLDFVTSVNLHKYTIADVLIALPGHNIVVPRNGTQMWYNQVLQNDELCMEDFKAKVKCYSVSGTYRKMLVYPENVRHNICYYNDLKLPLLLSDYDALQKQDVKKNLLKEGLYKAILLEMRLPSSSYATMALRELLRMDTSSQFQSKLNSIPEDQKKENDNKIEQE